MPNDLTARLRDAYVDTKHGPSFRLSLNPLDLIAAADLIDAQAKEIERLRKALEQLEIRASRVAQLGALPGTQWPPLNSAIIQARAALKEKPHD